MSRLDVALTDRGLAKSRNVAQTLIKNGQITVNGRLVNKASFAVEDTDLIELMGDLPRYVGRGGEKLEKAVEVFGIALDGCVCLDVGASTGGFTDCMLQKGAEKVYAVDVGTNQLDQKLRADGRVISLEQLDIRKATDEIPPVDFTAIDVSFISLKLILPEVKRFLKPGKTFVALVKPQFEAGRKYLSKNGVVKDKTVQEKVLADIKEFAAMEGYTVLNHAVSPILGGDGNRAFLLFLKN